jgi:hypothetical protein
MREFKRLAELWGYSQEMGQALEFQVRAYHDNEHPFNRYSGDHDPLRYWYSLPDIESSAALRTLAIAVLNIAPHGASIEGLFSIMKFLKPSYRCNMSKFTHVRLAQLKLILEREQAHALSVNESELESSDQCSNFHQQGFLEPRTSNIQQCRQNVGPNDNVSEFQVMEDLDAICEAVDYAEQLGLTSLKDLDEVELVMENRETAFMESLFDLEMAEFVPSNTSTKSSASYMMGREIRDTQTWDPLF